MHKHPNSLPEHIVWHDGMWLVKKNVADYHQYVHYQVWVA